MVHTHNYTTLYTRTILHRYSQYNIVPRTTVPTRDLASFREPTYLSDREILITLPYSRVNLYRACPFVAYNKKQTTPSNSNDKC